MLKKISLLAFLMFFVAGSINVFAQEEEEVEQLPDLEIKNLDGETINVLEHYGQSGQITVFSFWATWCVPCKKELNNIAEYYPDWQEEYGIKIVAVVQTTLVLFPKFSLMSTVRNGNTMYY